MNEGGWNLVEPEHASAKSVESEISEGSSMKEVTASGRPALKKEASFAWRGGQERQTTGTFRSSCLCIFPFFWKCSFFLCVELHFSYHLSR